MKIAPVFRVPPVVVLVICLLELPCFAKKCASAPWLPPTQGSCTSVPPCNGTLEGDSCTISGASGNCDAVPGSDVNTIASCCYCNATGGPPPPPPPGPQHDPHIFTADGLFYDFQGVGDFVLATVGQDLTLQAHFEPSTSSELTAASWTTAVAAQLGQSTVAVYAANTTPLWINGAPQALTTAGLQIGADATIALIHAPPGDTIIISSTTGAIIRVMLRTTNAGFKYMNVRVPAGLTAASRGLLGSGDGDISNDVASKDGTVFSSPMTVTQLYSQFGDSWRVAPGESLFSTEALWGGAAMYKAPEHWENPTTQLTVQELTPWQRSRGLDLCTSAGVTDPALLDACTLDMAASDGSTSILEDYATMSPPLATMTVLADAASEGSESADLTPTSGCSLSEGPSRAAWSALILAGLAAIGAVGRRAGKRHADAKQSACR